MRRDQGLVLLLVLFVSLLVTGVAPAVEVEVALTVDGVAYKLDEINGTTLGLIRDVVKAEFDRRIAYEVLARTVAWLDETDQASDVAETKLKRVIAKANLVQTASEATRMKRVLAVAQAEHKQSLEKWGTVLELAEASGAEFDLTVAKVAKAKLALTAHCRRNLRLDSAEPR